MIIYTIADNESLRSPVEDRDIRTLLMSAGLEVNPQHESIILISRLFFMNGVVWYKWRYRVIKRILARNPKNDYETLLHDITLYPYCNPTYKHLYPLRCNKRNYHHIKRLLIATERGQLMLTEKFHKTFNLEYAYENLVHQLNTYSV